MAKQFLDLLDDYYAKELRGAKSNAQAYEQAVEKFEREVGVNAPSSFDAFRMRKYRKKKTR